MTFGSLLARQKVRFDLATMARKRADSESTGRPRAIKADVPSWELPDDAEGTRLWSDPALLESEKRLASAAELAARVRPASGVRPRPTGAGLGQSFIRAGHVEPQRVRALYDHFLFVVGPAARFLFERELQSGGMCPGRLLEGELDALVEGLASRIPAASARARFLARAAEVQLH